MGVLRTIRRIWWLTKISLIMSLGAVLAIVVIGVIYLTSQSDLSNWHTVALEEEFTAKSNVSTFRDYLALEDRLFRELDDKINSKTAWGNRDEINRFQPETV